MEPDVQGNKESLDTKSDVKLKRKEGFVKSKRSTIMEYIGPNSPLPDRWKIFEFIKYRIEDNKRESETERISRDYIVKNTGIQKANFARNIKLLERDKLLLVYKTTYRDAVFGYRLHPERFGESIVCRDLKKMPKHHFDEAKHQFDESQHQNEESTPQSDTKVVVNIMELLPAFPLRSPLPITSTLKSPGNTEETRSRQEGAEAGSVPKDMEAEKKRQLEALAMYEKGRV